MVNIASFSSPFFLFICTSIPFLIFHFYLHFLFLSSYVFSQFPLLILSLFFLHYVHGSHHDDDCLMFVLPVYVLHVGNESCELFSFSLRALSRFMSKGTLIPTSWHNCFSGCQMVLSGLFWLVFIIGSSQLISI